MAQTIKVMALEVDGVDYEYGQEVLLSVENIVSSNNLYGEGDLQEILEYIRNNPVVDPSTLPKYFYCQFQATTTFSYYSQYLTSHANKNTNRYNDLPSGSTNGINYGASAPILCPFSGTVEKVNVAVKSVAHSEGSTVTSANLELELWSVGFSNEGTKISTIIVPINGTIGTWGSTNVNTDFKGTITLPSPISIPANTLLGLKFINRTGTNKVVAIRDFTVGLEVKSVV